jgi:hypothetical protein
MNRRERWHAVLDAEIKRWSEKSYEELRSTLSELLVYEVEFDSKQHQAEVELLESTPNYVHVSISVDDGTLASLRPLTGSFIRPASHPDEIVGS